MGEPVGWDRLGEVEGRALGEFVGSTVVCMKVGWIEGGEDGVKVGWVEVGQVGLDVGAFVGRDEGEKVGLLWGEIVGC